jgi:hypothetical protein
LYVFGFGALLGQHDGMPGSGMYLSGARLQARMRRDFPGPRRFLEYPSVFWLYSSDRVLRMAPVFGVLAGLCAIVGGPHAGWALGFAWVLWLSLESRGLIFPWDTMLQELGFLVLFMPATQLLPELRASALPLPSVAFMLRWLVIRLMIGFGKEKFIGTRKNDHLYLRGFFVWMPLPTPLGWFAHHAPAWMLRSMLLFMFFAEIIAPVLGLFSGPLRLVAFGALVTLMLGIQSTGNWGFFNLGYILIATCLLDVHGSIFDLMHEPWLSRLGSWPDVAIHSLMAVMFLISVLYVPNNTWFTRTWLAWPADMFPLPHKWMPLAQRVHRLFEPLRVISGLRLVNGYGVFPPHAMPPLRLVPVFEGSDDGVTWKPYRYRFMPTTAHSRPPIIAPYHARFDQFVYYVGMGIDTGSLFGSLYPIAHPYATYTHSSPFDQLVQRLLEHDPRAGRLFGHNPFQDRPPKLVRVSILGMTPTRVRELRATGRWWHVRRFGTLIPARGLETWPDRLALNEPELFHPDLVDYRRRAKPLRDIVAAFQSGMPFEQAAIAGSDLTPADVRAFWSELLPELNLARGDWSQIHERTDALRARFGIEGLFRLERVLERFVWLLRQQTDGLRFGQTEPSLPVMSNFRYHMFLQDCVCDGREAYAALLAEPRRAVERAQSSTDATQLWAVGILRYDQVMANISTFRGSEMGLASVEQGLPGVFEYFDLLVKVVPRGEEFVPRFVLHPDGEHTIEGFYPPPPLPIDRPAAGGGVTDPV